jgi:hypothetical protein
MCGGVLQSAATANVSLEEAGCAPAWGIVTVTALAGQDSGPPVFVEL